MKMLFINSLKGLKKKKIQILSIISLVMLSSCIYTMINSSLDRIEDNYYDYLNTNKAEHFAFSLDLDYENDYTLNEIIQLESTTLKNISEEEKELINFYKMCLTNKESCEGLSIYETISQFFDYHNIYVDKVEEKMIPLVEKYNISYELSESKVINESKKVYKFFPYNIESQINIPYLIEGDFPKNDNEITLLPLYMEENNLNIGDTYEINEKKYIIVGKATSPDHIFPLLSISTPMYQSSNHTIVFTTINEFNNINGIVESSYVARFNDLEYTTIDPNKLQDIFEEGDLKFSMFSALRLIRINQLSMEINTNRIFSEYFMYLLLGIAAIITIIITKKRIETEKKQIGILKAMGYNNIAITLSYLLYPIIGGLIGGILGYILGLTLNPFMSQLYLTIYIIPLSDIVINLEYLIYTTLLPTIILTLVCFVIILFMLRHKALYLLKEGSDLKTNFLTKLTSKITSRCKFKTKFRLSLASRSIPKLLLIMVTAFTTGLLITLNLIGMNLFSSSIEKSFNGLDFDYWIQYKSEELLIEHQEETYLLNKEFSILSIKDKNLVDKEILKEDYVLSVNGIDPEITNMQIYNEKNENIVSKLTSGNIIINKNTADILKIEINDILEIEYYDKILTYTVVDINESFMGSYAYVNRIELTQQLGLANVYNSKYTSLEKYDNLNLLEAEELDNISSIFSLVDLKENMEVTMQASSNVIYVIIAFSGLMSFIIITVIANIVIEENKKNISVMKVLGYNDKTISSIVLNIYTPFIIVSYLISIPIMISILKLVVSLLTESMEYSLPISISLPKAALGLIVLLVGYYISIYITKKNLNKIPLSESLKRE